MRACETYEVMRCSCFLPQCFQRIVTHWSFARLCLVVYCIWMMEETAVLTRDYFCPWLAFCYFIAYQRALYYVFQSDVRDSPWRSRCGYIFSMLSNRFSFAKHWTDVWTQNKAGNLTRLYIVLYISMLKSNPIQVWIILPIYSLFGFVLSQGSWQLVDNDQQNNFRNLMENNWWIDTKWCLNFHIVFVFFWWHAPLSFCR